MWQATGKSSGSAGPPGSRRAGAAAGAAVLWWVLTAVASQGLALGAPGMSREEADAVIARSHQWVAGYLETLPNFTCRKTIRVFVVPAIRKPECESGPKRCLGDRDGSPNEGCVSARGAGINDTEDREWLVRMVKGGRESYEWVRRQQAWTWMGIFRSLVKELFLARSTIRSSSGSKLLACGGMECMCSGR